ncbi:hypothetical protein MKX03_015369, partial [Papaver bracteatum]
KAAVALINSDHTGAFVGGKTYPATTIEGEDIAEQAASTKIQWLLLSNHPNVQIECDNEKVLEAVARAITRYKKDRIMLHGGTSKNFILCINSTCNLNLIPENSIASMLAAKCLQLSYFSSWDANALSSFLPSTSITMGETIFVLCHFRVSPISSIKKKTNVFMRDG